MAPGMDGQLDFKERTYLMTNDLTEQKRLDRQSYAIWKAMGDRHVTAPIPTDASLLVDVGCGPGGVSKSLAADHPGARVVAVDLSPVLITDNLPANLDFVRGDIFDLAGHHPLLQENTADLVFSRLLIGGLRGPSRWREYVETVTRLLKPGGHANLVEVAIISFGCSNPADPLGTKHPKHVQVVDDLREALMSHGFDADIGLHLTQHMKDAGLIDVEVQEYVFGFRQWSGKHCQGVEAFEDEGQSANLADGMSKVFVGRMSEADVSRKRDELYELFENDDDTFLLLYAARGRKPG